MKWFLMQCITSISAGLIMVCYQGLCSEALSDTDAATLISNGWKESGLSIPIGEFEVLRQDAVEFGGVKPDIQKHQLSVITIRDAEFTITKIIKNREIKSTVDTYRMVMTTYDAAWTPAVKEVFAYQGNPVEDKRKAKVLLKYDPFTSKWKQVAADYANLESEFSTRNVDNTLLDVVGPAVQGLVK